MLLLLKIAIYSENCHLIQKTAGVSGLYQKGSVFSCPSKQVKKPRAEMTIHKQNVQNSKLHQQQYFLIWFGNLSKFGFMLTWHGISLTLTTIILPDNFGQANKVIAFDRSLNRRTSNIIAVIMLLGSWSFHPFSENLPL